MKKLSLLVALLATLVWATPSRAEFQLGGSGILLGGDDNALPGLNFEFGGYYPGGIVNSFFGAQLFFAGGDGDSDISADEGYFGFLGLYRGYFPLGTDTFKLYGEGGLGLGASGVDYTWRNSDRDDSKFGLSFQIGLGAEFAFTPNFSLRGGYDFIGLPKADGDYGEIGGGFHSLNLGVTFRF